jgi:hypothetical protein
LAEKITAKQIFFVTTSRCRNWFFNSAWLRRENLGKPSILKSTKEGQTTVMVK